MIAGLLAQLARFGAHVTSETHDKFDPTAVTATSLPVRPHPATVLSENRAYWRDARRLLIGGVLLGVMLLGAEAVLSAADAPLSLRADVNGSTLVSGFGVLAAVAVALQVAVRTSVGDVSEPTELTRHLARRSLLSDVAAVVALAISSSSVVAAWWVSAGDLLDLWRFWAVLGGGFLVALLACDASIAMDRNLSAELATHKQERFRNKRRLLVRYYERRLGEGSGLRQQWWLAPMLGASALALAILPAWGGWALFGGISGGQETLVPWLLCAQGVSIVAAVLAAFVRRTRLLYGPLASMYQALVVTLFQALAAALAFFAFAPLGGLNLAGWVVGVAGPILVLATTAACVQLFSTRLFLRWVPLPYVLLNWFERRQLSRLARPAEKKASSESALASLAGLLVGPLVLAGWVTFRDDRLHQVGVRWALISAGVWVVVAATAAALASVGVLG